ncbi:hypothetical protein PPL_08327 [Heterostelium album PN500]|uniref:Uncharacterized protein n=1 Tax=Heterostelium pallidum (strain ATCC 26659 / Pp 5 / PN500) TaxID=670386 RepID=D3BHV9_HETP5|nr:hypothetical protein PPL_08327 [Heterostelium album PN500]EFA78859.1 hypothetical protein PPL_08327 [Heterostelium album PN500]|eukprot:XP_020430983.1 hypothetical protein PPL_08327 [Heterostelium album PN500]
MFDTDFGSLSLAAEVGMNWTTRYLDIAGNGFNPSPRRTNGAFAITADGIDDTTTGFGILLPLTNSIISFSFFEINPT